MKENLNEIKRLQKLAGLLNEEEYGISYDEADDLLDELRYNDAFQHDVFGKIEDEIRDRMGDDYDEDDVYEQTIDKMINILMKNPNIWDEYRNSLNENHMEDDGLSEYDKRYKNTDDDLTIFDVEEGKEDTSGPWATTATSSVFIHVMSREGERYSLDDIMDWAIMVPGFKSVDIVQKEIGEIYETTPGEWAFELTTTVWQN